MSSREGSYRLLMLLLMLRATAHSARTEECMFSATCVPFRFV